MKPRNYRRTRGFTLIELLAVISIIVILAGLTTAAVGFVRKNVRKAVAKARFSTYMAAITVCKNDNGYYPEFGIPRKGDEDLLFPQPGDQGDWEDFWKTLYGLEAPDEWIGGRKTQLDLQEARDFGNLKRREYVTPQEENHYKAPDGDLDWSSIRGVYKEKNKDREQVFLLLTLMAMVVLRIQTLELRTRLSTSMKLSGS